MQWRTLAVVAVVLLVAFSGCAGLEGLDDDPANDTDVNEETNTDTNDQSDDTDADDTGSDNTGTDDGSGESTGGETNTDSGDETSDNGGSGASDNSNSGSSNNGGSETSSDSGGETSNNNGDNTANAEWQPPREPNRPLENEREDRIESVEFVDKEPAQNGEGYSNFNLEVVANTSMENIDPPEHGNVIGEPYFFVKINEGRDNQKIIERTGQVSMSERGTYHIDVRPEGIKEFGERENLTVEVFLMDEDKDWDDIYASVGKKIHFNPETGGS